MKIKDNLSPDIGRNRLYLFGVFPYALRLCLNSLNSGYIILLSVGHLAVVFLVGLQAYALLLGRLFYGAGSDIEISGNDGRNM